MDYPQRTKLKEALMSNDFATVAKIWKHLKRFMTEKK